MDLFNLPLLNEFMETADLKDREKVEWTLEHEKTVSERYFSGYAHWFQEEGFAEALATIPYTFVCDDHDIFDGYGSYPAAQQGSPVIQNIGRIGYRFYLLFQHHTTFQRAFQDSLFPENKGYNWIKQFGSNTLVLALDNRSSRTEYTIINEDCWTSIWNTLETRLQDSPTPIRHLYIVATVPVVYPRLLAVDNAMEAISKLQSVGRKVFGPLIKCILPEKEEKVFLGGVGHGAVMHRLRGSFGQPDLRDDLMDEWTHPNHLEERNRMVERLQQIAEEKRVRVTFLSGDVHICGVGRFRTEGSDVVPDLLGENVRMDSKAMYQVISSAIVNSPGPDLVVSLLHSNPRVISPKVTKLPNTVEEMFELFEKDVDGKILKHKRLLPRRNWSCFETQENGSYKVEIHVENMNHAEESVVYGFSIPELV
ncbi:hypothetical protein HDU79_011587 [Rhizoclosmatium sp. JEL0117]|nr:hypothetical protein HDU79_011587 [Rhizoclosmatium sp. JEL0117]